MLSTLLTQIQTNLLSKRFVLGSLFPLFLFLFANGWMLYRHWKPVPDWVAKIEGLKEQALLVTLLSTGILAVAYAFSALSSTLLEWLEAKAGPLRWISPWLHWNQRLTLDRLERGYDAVARDALDFGRALAGGSRDWIEQLRQARGAGALTDQCDARWEERPEAEAVRRVLGKARRGRRLSYAELEHAVAGLRLLLSTSSANLDHDAASRKLALAFLSLQEAIHYARDRSQAERIRLYNQRQFTYPGNREPASHSVLAPTTMGNIGRTMQTYALTRYNLDLDVFWSRLQNSVQSNKDYFGMLQDVKGQVDFFVAVIFLSALFTAIWTPVVFLKRSAVEFLLVGATGFLPFLLYPLACKTYQVFADVVRSAVDLFRFKMLTDLHLPLPSWIEEEKLLWERLGNLTGYARAEIVKYKHPGA